MHRLAYSSFPSSQSRSRFNSAHETAAAAKIYKFEVFLLVSSSPFILCFDWNRAQTSYIKHNSVSNALQLHYNLDNLISIVTNYEYQEIIAVAIIILLFVFAHSSSPVCVCVVAVSFKFLKTLTNSVGTVLLFHFCCCGAFRWMWIRTNVCEDDALADALWKRANKRNNSRIIATDIYNYTFNFVFIRKTHTCMCDVCIVARIVWSMKVALEQFSRQ